MARRSAFGRAVLLVGALALVRLAAQGRKAWELFGTSSCSEDALWIHRLHGHDWQEPLFRRPCGGGGPLRFNREREGPVEGAQPQCQIVVARKARAPEPQSRGPKRRTGFADGSVSVSSSSQVSEGDSLPSVDVDVSKPLWHVHPEPWV